MLTAKNITVFIFAAFLCVASMVEGRISGPKMSEPVEINDLPDAKIPDDHRRLTTRDVNVGYYNDAEVPRYTVTKVKFTADNSDGTGSASCTIERDITSSYGENIASCQLPAPLNQGNDDEWDITVKVWMTYAGFTWTKTKTFRNIPGALFDTTSGNGRPYFFCTKTQGSAFGGERIQHNLPDSNTYYQSNDHSDEDHFCPRESRYNNAIGI